MSDYELRFVEAQLCSLEEKSGNVPVSVRGRLRKSVQFWRDIDAPRFIVDTIEFGYKLPLLQIPRPFVATNKNSALRESEFVESALDLGPSSCQPVSFQTEDKSIVVFLDDGLGAATDYTKARVSNLSVHADLLKSGYFPNEEKSL